MSVFTPDVNIDSPIPLPIDGGNPNAVKVDGSAVTQPVSGNVTVSGTVTANLGTVDGLALNTTLTNGTQHTLVDNFPATQPVSGTVTVTQPTGTNLHVVVDSGAITVSTNKGATATQTQVLATVSTSVLLLAANANRKKAILSIPTLGIIFISYGATASATNWAYKFVNNNAVLEEISYTGAISAFSQSGTTNLVNITEIS